MRYRLSRHAKEEMARRGIPDELLDEVLQHPQKVIGERGGRNAYQSLVDFGGGRIFLLRVLVADDADPAVVGSVYRTSKIGKHWR